MAYEPTTWVCGDTVTAERLNHMEQGIASCVGGLVATYESHYKEFDGVPVDIKEVWVMTGINEWSELRVIYDSTLYDNIGCLNWVTDTEDAYNSPYLIEVVHLPSVAPAEPYESGAYVNDAIDAYRVEYGDSSSEVIIVRDDSAVKYKA